MILTSPARSKDQTDNKEKDNTTQNNKKQLDVCPNASMIQNQNPNLWIPGGSNILGSFQCIPTSYDFSTMIRIIQDRASSSSEGENSSSSSGASSSRHSTSLTSLSLYGQWLRRECFAFVELDRPCSLIIDVVVARSDEDDSHPVLRRMTTEDGTRMQCRTAVDIVSTYSRHAIQDCAMH